MEVCRNRVAHTKHTRVHTYICIILLVLGRIELQEHEQEPNSVRYGVYGVASPLRALQRQRQKQKYQSRLEQSILG